MSWNPAVNPQGHVPVGTGQQFPLRDERQARRVVNHGQHGPDQVIVVRPNGRNIPPQAAAFVRGQAQDLHIPTVVFIEQQPLPLLVVQPQEEPGVMRQIPGTRAAIVTKK